MKKMLERFLPLLVAVISSFVFVPQSHAMPKQVDFQMRTLNNTGEQIEICVPNLPNLPNPASCEAVPAGSKAHENYLSSELNTKEPFSYILSLRVVKVCNLFIPMAKMIDAPVISQDNGISTYFLTISRKTYLLECGDNLEKNIIKKQKTTDGEKGKREK